MDRFDLNEDTLWSGEPYDNVNPKGLAAIPEVRRLLFGGDSQAAQELFGRDIAGKWNQSYQPLADLQIQYPFGDDVTDYHRELDLSNATAHVEFTSQGVHYSRDIFASNPAQAIVIRLNADTPGKISFTARLDSQLHHAVCSGGGFLSLVGRAPSWTDPSYVYKGNVIYDDAANGKGMRFEARVKVFHEGGVIKFVNDSIVAQHCDNVTIVLVAATSFNGAHKSPSAEGKDPAKLCDHYLRRISGQSYEQLKAWHVADYQSLFNRVSLNLDTRTAELPSTDERITAYQPGSDLSLAALYFNYGRYLLISSSRPGGEPANLQGLWNHDLCPPWSANYTLNCNVEINYWAAEAVNLPECVDPLLDMTQELSVDGENVAKNLYGARGWVAHHNTDLWRQAGPVGGLSSMFQIGSAWLCQHLWEHYAFSGDKKYLRQIYPTLKGAAEFYLSSMVEEPMHRYLITSPDLNFENYYIASDGRRGRLCYGPTNSSEMIRELLHNCIAATEILNVDPDFRSAAQKTLPRLPPIVVSKTTGELQEWLEDWKRGELSEMLSCWGAVCSSQITPRGTPELAEALRKMLNNTPECNFGSWQGAF